MSFYKLCSQCNVGHTLDEWFSRKPSHECCSIMQLTGKGAPEKATTLMNSASIVEDDGNIIDGLGIVCSDNCPDNNAR